MPIAQDIKIQRKLLRLSQRELASTWAMDNTLLARIESGTRSVKNFVPEVAEFLGVEEFDLRRRLAEEELAAYAGSSHISQETIEIIAERDRAIALRDLGRAKFNF